MEREDVKKSLIEVVSEILDKSEEDIQMDESFANQGADELDLIEIIMCLEDDLDLYFEELDEDNLGEYTPNTLIDYIVKQYA